MGVAFDAVGPTAACQLITAASGGTRSWTHTAGSGGGTVLVFLTCGVTGASAGALGSFASVTYDGNPMTLLSSVSSNNSTWGGIFCYGIAGQATGARTVAVGTYTVPAGSTFAQIIGVSISFTGSSGFGTPVTAFGSAAAGSAVVTSTVTGGVSVAGACDGSGGETVTAGTQRFLLDQSTANTGNMAGATIASAVGTTTLSFAWTSDFFATIGVEVRPAAGQPERLPQQTSRALMKRRKASQRPQFNLQSPNVTIAVQALNAPVFLPGATLPGTPVLCQLAGTPGPGWFTDQYGKPMLWVATETWCLPVRAGEWNGGNWQLDYDSFFSRRAAQGVTVTITDPFQSGADPVTNAPFLNGSTWDGINPFTSPGVLNATFWARIDYMIDAADRYGITIAFTFNTGYDFVTGGPYDTWTNSTFLAFGQALGTRYGSKQNIVWMFGNDVFPGSYDSNWDNVITGLRGNGANQLVGAWWHAEYTSRYETDNNTAATWGVANSQFDFTYSYNVGYWVIEYAYNETAAPDSQAHLLPVFEGDGYWFGGGSTYDSTQDRAWRQEKWWVLASGSRGILTESDNVWQWGSAAALAAVTTDWSFVHTLPAITSYFLGLAGWYNLLPDLSSALVTAGRGTRSGGFSTGGVTYEPAFTNNYVAASKTPDGTLAVLYLPVHTTVTVNTALLAAGWTATWVDPVNTATSSAGGGPTFNSTAKGNNSQGDPDWVLVFASPASKAQARARQVLASGASFPGGLATFT